MTVTWISGCASKVAGRHWPVGRRRPVVIATTVVRTKRLLGKAYLAAIMPFHRCVARTLLQQVVRQPAGQA
jgi:hypothetical protein